MCASAIYALQKYAKLMLNVVLTKQTTVLDVFTGLKPSLTCKLQTSGAA